MAREGSQRICTRMQRQRNEQYKGKLGEKGQIGGGGEGEENRGS